MKIAEQLWRWKHPLIYFKVSEKLSSPVVTAPAAPLTWRTVIKSLATSNHASVPLFSHLQRTCTYILKVSFSFPKCTKKQHAWNLTQNQNIDTHITHILLNSCMFNLCHLFQKVRLISFNKKPTNPRGGRPNSLPLPLVVFFFTAPNCSEITWQWSWGSFGKGI